MTSLESLQKLRKSLDGIVHEMDLMDHYDKELPETIAIAYMGELAMKIVCSVAREFTGRAVRDSADGVE